MYFRAHFIPITKKPMPRWYITAVSFVMKKCLFVLSALVLFAFSSCQKYAGDPVTKEFPIDGTYTELEVAGAFVVTVSDAATAITVTVGENVMPNVKVENVEGKLKIYLKPAINISGPNEMAVILPYNANLTHVDLSGASEFRSAYRLEGHEVEVDLSGNSGFYCDIEADEVDMELSGTSYAEGFVDASDLDLNMSGESDATLWGQATTLDLALSGASTIKRTITGSNYGLECDFCNGTMSGSSVAYIHCNAKVNVILSGASELHFTGDADSTSSQTSGGSRIIHDEQP